MVEAVTTEQLWGTMRQRLMPFIRQRVRTSEDAEDIVQEVFLRIHSKLGDLKNTEAITAWIFQIARNAVTDHYRARARAVNAYETLKGQGDSPARFLSQDDLPDDRVAEAELSSCVEPLIEALPGEYGQALALTEIGGLTQKEAAAKLGLSLSGMKSRVQRGRGKLKDLLLDCCNVALDRRKGVIEYEARADGQSCSDDCGCKEK